MGGGRGAQRGHGYVPRPAPGFLGVAAAPWGVSWQCSQRRAAGRPGRGGRAVWCMGEGGLQAGHLLGHATCRGAAVRLKSLPEAPRHTPAPWAHAALADRQTVGRVMAWRGWRQAGVRVGGGGSATAAAVYWQCTGGPQKARPTRAPPCRACVRACVTLHSSRGARPATPRARAAPRRPRASRAAGCRRRGSCRA